MTRPRFIYAIEMNKMKKLARNISKTILEVKYNNDLVSRTKEELRGEIMPKL